MRNNPKSLVCWHCGIHLKDIVLPIERSAQCPQCRVDLHVCRMCRHYDTRYTSNCAHQLADKVLEKDRVNHCTYLRARHNAYEADDDRDGRDNRDALEALFGGEATRDAVESAASRAEFSQARKDKARQALDGLFGDEEKH